MTCPHCNNSGMLSIWSGLSIKQLRVDELRFVRTVAVACCCTKGERYLKLCRNWRFDERKMFPWNGDTPEERQRVLEFSERRRSARMASYEFRAEDWQ